MRLLEIVAAILEQLDQNFALFAVLQVNKFWAHEATTVLWRVDPPCQPFAHLEDAERLQYYADKISWLCLQCDENECEGHFKLQHLHFPRLDSIDIPVSGRNDEQISLQYLQPTLRRFNWYGGPRSNYYLKQIRARCPAL